MDKVLESVVVATLAFSILSTTLVDIVESKPINYEDVCIVIIDRELPIDIFIKILRIVIAAAGLAFSLPFAAFALLAALPAIIVEFLNNYIIIPFAYLVIAIAYLLAIPLLTLLELLGMDGELPSMEEVLSKVYAYLKEMEAGVEEFYRFLYLSIPFIACILVIVSAGELSFGDAVDEVNRVITDFISGGGLFPY